MPQTNAPALSTRSSASCLCDSGLALRAVVARYLDLRSRYLATTTALKARGRFRRDTQLDDYVLRAIHLSAGPYIQLVLL